jgi:hypothetical protein
MYSCCNEDCAEYAELMVESNGGLVKMYEMLNAFKDVVQEITDEKNKVHRD